MASNWYYSKNGQKFGPVSSTQLKSLAISGEIQSEDLVWKDGMEKWVKADRVKSLFATGDNLSSSSKTSTVEVSGTTDNNQDEYYENLGLFEYCWRSYSDTHTISPRLFGNFLGFLALPVLSMLKPGLGSKGIWSLFVVTLFLAFALLFIQMLMGLMKFIFNKERNIPEGYFTWKSAFTSFLFATSIYLGLSAFIESGSGEKGLLVSLVPPLEREQDILVKSLPKLPQKNKPLEQSTNSDVDTVDSTNKPLEDVSNTSQEEPLASDIPKATLRSDSKVENQEVIADGKGETDDAALKDAFRNAVRKVVGVYVDQETLVKDDELITDNVLTLSNGFIKSYKEISKSEKDGIRTVSIEAVVENQAILTKLEAVKISVKKINLKNIVDKEMDRMASELTQEQALKDAGALFEASVKKLPDNILLVRTVGEPEQSKQDGDKIDLTFTIELSIDIKAYENLKDKVDALLKRTSQRQGDFTMLSKIYDGQFEVPEKLDLVPKDVYEYKKGMVLLNTHRSRDFSRTEWNYYHLGIPIESLKTYSDRKCTIKLSLLSSKGDLIANDRFEFEDSSYNVNPITINKGSNSHQYPFGDKCYMISPFFFDTYSMSRFQYKTKSQMKRTISLTVDEIKMIDLVRCELDYSK
jgi:hypothetical protein